MSQRVLIIDNEEMVLSFLRRALESSGYEVFQAENRAQAEAVLSTLPESAAILLVVDVALQGESGIELAADLARQHPQGRFLFISGYVDDVLFLNGRAAAARTAFLQKPFSRDAVVEALERLSSD